MHNFQKKIAFSPQTFLRAFRFVSLYNLKWAEELFVEFDKSFHMFKEIPNGRLQSEAYDILKGKNVLRSLFYYEKLGLISQNKKLDELKDTEIPLYNQNTSARLIYLSYLLGKNTIIEWVNLHNISGKLIEDIQEYLHYLKTDSLKIHPKKLPFLTLLKRYQYKDDKDKIKEFLRTNK
jgi:tRNA nucleotidyltransferase/poly(A) polymerase